MLVLFHILFDLDCFKTLQMDFFHQIVSKYLSIDSKGYAIVG